MIITLTRSGGFTGIPFKKTIDTATLPKEKAKKIEDDLRSMIPSFAKATEGKQDLGLKKTSCPDRFTYSISIDDGINSSEVKLNEESLSSEAQKLVDYLQNL